jgi:putative two-component system response regulator
LKTIFVVDDNNVNLLSADEALSKYYNIFTLPSASSMFELLENVRPDLILLDIMMPDMDGFEALKILKSNSRYEEIPVIFLTSKKDTSTESHGFEMGVIDYISKPFSEPVLINRIKTHLGVEDIIRHRTDSLKKLKNGIVTVLANMVEHRDTLTGSHVERTTKYIQILFKAMQQNDLYSDEISQWNMDTVISSVRLHDIGKIAISDLLLNKQGPLTPEEFEIMKTHAAEGEKIIEEIITESGDGYFLQHAKLFAGYHHERWDGTGYPYGLKGTDIPLQGRIMALVDVYDALVSDRPYKKAFTHEKALEIIREGDGSHFDTKLVKAFLSCEKEIQRVKSSENQG